MKILILSLVCATSLIWADSPKGYKEVQDQCELKILTRSLSERKTAKIRLNNGLEAYLISDPKANQSAAALSMEVGSWNDDPQYMGIAHFLEHLLFMGSKTYPEENSYDKQVWDNGGTLNAYTAPDRTVYIFSVNNDSFLTTLDMFSHMFTDPLFNPSGIKRELHAVDQEHDKNIESDRSRLWMVFKETGNPNHPNALFSTGNAETLGEIPQKEVKRWHKNNYSSDRAHLVLYSTLPIEELKTQTARLFSSVPQSSNSITSSKEKLFSERQEGNIIAVKPFKDLRSLSIEWELSHEYLQNLDNKAHNLLGYIFGGRHASSLYTQLKNEGLIEDISSGMMRAGKETALFSISFDLTLQGAKQFEVVIERCFQTLNSLKASSIPFYIFNEMKTMAKIDYEFQSRMTPYTFVQNHAHNLIDEPLETYPLKTTLHTTYDGEETQKFLTNLTPESAAYFLIAPPDLTGIHPDKEETWTGAEYAIRKISTETLTAWNTLPPHPNITLPEQNHFIPGNLKLVKNQGDGTIHVTPRPEKLVENDRGTLYFWEDTQYQVPEISWIFNVYTPLIDGTARQIVLFDLFSYTLDEKLAPILSYAEPASLGMSCHASDMKFSLQINGYSEKAPLLLNEILNKLKDCKMTKEEFKLYCAALKSNYANVGKAMPVLQGIEIYQNLLFNNAPKHLEKIATLQNLTYEDYLSFADNFLDDCYLEALFAGNMTEKEAHQTWTIIHEKLGANPYPKKNHEKKQMLTLSASQGPYKIPAQTESLGNAAILIIQQGAMTVAKKASHSILGTALQEDFFDTLRTKQQTAYIAKAMSAEEEEQLYNLFLVQSTSHQPDELIARFELFLETYIKDFETVLSEGRFELIKSNVITLLETPPTNLRQMASQLHTLAFTYKGDFERREKLIAALKELSYEDFKKDTNTFLSRKNPKRIAIMLEGKQSDRKAFRYEGITAENLKMESTYISLP
ncbi:MAG: insulinase family protein [Candidatus Neptunochlamydia sp.]|nr:insulinase family protein [Candidatus Neptunochlamydia sp.]